MSEVGRTLRFEGLPPHRVRQWLKSTDPDFDAKAQRVCDLYLHPPKGVVVCVDEKPLQVLARKHETRVDERDGSLRREYEYKRHRTRALLAAFDVKTGAVFGQVVPSRSADALVAFMDELAAKYPDEIIHVVWDNLNTHRQTNPKPSPTTRRASRPCCTDTVPLISAPGATAPPSSCNLDPRTIR